MSVWVRLVVAVAMLKCVAAIGVAVVSDGYSSTPLLYSPYQYGLLVLAFGATGAALIAARTGDRRAVWLGCILVLTAAPFAGVLLSCCATATIHPALTKAADLLGRTPLDPLLPVFFWLFVRHFPDEPAPLAGVRTPRIATLVLLALAVLLIVSNLSEFVWPIRPGPLNDVRAHVSRQSVDSLYWPIIIAASLPSLGFLVWKAWTARLADRRRVHVFVAGLLLGFAPIFIEILLEALSPSYARFATGPAGTWIAELVFLSLLAVPLVTAYSVLVDRVVEIRLVIRSALQYALAKYSLLLLMALPLAGIVRYLYAHRDETLLHLVSGSGLPLLVAGVVAAGVMLRMRSRALTALDRRFFREEYDARSILNELADRCRKATTIDELVSLVCRDVDRALHVDYVTMLLATSDGTVLRSPDGRIRPLSRSSGLALLAQGDSTSLLVDLETADSTLRRLPEEERNWLADSGFHLLVPLNASDGSLHGLIGLGQKLSELPYSREDRQVLEAIGASVSLTVENRRLRESGATTPKAGRHAVLPWLAADDGRPAVECEACGRVYPPETSVCDCGSALESALVPFVLGNKFQLDRRLGRGGMGVVYRALDMDLGRHVAIKTLPHVGPEDAARLRREARAMASVQHENLAVIFGAETWLGTPLLVVELLAGGTLAALLRRGPIPWPRALEIGIALSRGVEHLHRAGVLHCDIKPSNIGFTREEVPKLLDFGLATMLRDRRTGGSTTTRSGRLGDRLIGSITPGGTERSGFGGTPLYMSPEAIDGASPQTAFDVWSLSVVMFEAIAGAPPFDGATVAAIAAAVQHGHVPDIRARAPACPEAVATFFNRALSHRPGNRPPTATHLGNELTRLRDGARLE
ncbi:MAG TPA: protein kinase [Vicinamibacterales bacterium]|nr:protein kinase [Vicinamibacterales bacterium]